MDYYYITPGKVFGTITIDLHGGEIFDPSKLKFKYMEFSLDGYPEKWGTIITEADYDGKTCVMVTEDNGVDLYRCLLGYKMKGEEFEDYLVVHNSDSGEDFNWDLIDDIFTS